MDPLSSVDLAGLSLVGPGKRRCGDAYATATGSAGAAVAVADGVGSRPCDHAASATSVHATIDALRSVLDGSSPVSDNAVSDSVNAANDAVRHGAVGPCRGQRSTLVVALWDGATARVASVGDSRAYHIGRDRVAPSLITVDDTGLDRVPPALRHLEAARGRPLFREGLTQSLGQPGRLDVRVRTLPLAPAEALVLATDGAWHSEAFARVLDTACSSLDLGRTLARIGAAGIPRGDDATLAILRRQADPSSSFADHPDSPALRFREASRIWLNLVSAVDQGDAARVVEEAERYHRHDLGRDRLVSLADRLAASPTATREAFDALLRLARSSR